MMESRKSGNETTDISGPLTYVHKNVLSPVERAEGQLGIHQLRLHRQRNLLEDFVDGGLHRADTHSALFAYDIHRHAQPGRC